MRPDLLRSVVARRRRNRGELAARTAGASEPAAGGRNDHAAVARLDRAGSVESRASVKGPFSLFPCRSGVSPKPSFVSPIYELHGKRAYRGGDPADSPVSRECSRQSDLV